MLVEPDAFDAMRIENILEKHFPGHHCEFYSFPAEEILNLLGRRRTGKVLYRQFGEAYPSRTMLSTAVRIPGQIIYFVAHDKPFVDKTEQVKLVVAKLIPSSLG